MSKDNRYQIVQITLPNGKRGSFAGKVLMEKEDPPVLIWNIGIVFTEPALLPQGCSFESIGNLRDDSAKADHPEVKPTQKKDISGKKGKKK